MGNQFSAVPNNFDEYIDENKRHYPPMTVSIYKDGELREINGKLVLVAGL
jgi:hypothetical protein